MICQSNERRKKLNDVLANWRTIFGARGGQGHGRAAARRKALKLPHAFGYVPIQEENF